MNFHVLTLFPEMIENGMQRSITGKAIEKELFTLNAVNIRDYAEEHRKGRIDDYPYGGGAGMLMQAEPVYRCWKDVTDRIGRPARTVYLTPQGRLFNQQEAEDLAKEEDLILLCGHYEGIDERVLEECVTDYISIGDYVLTGGEMAAIVVMDAVSRLLPGVLHNSGSAEEESFSNGLLEYPHYTRPEIWHEKQVPPVLLSGHHANVEKWRLEQSLERTRERRPELYDAYMLAHPPLPEKKKRRKKRKNTACATEDNVLE